MDSAQFLTIPKDSDDSLQDAESRRREPGPSTEEYTSSQDDELYLERLETLYEKQLGEIDAFAKREGRPCEDVRKSIAQWHSKTLFDFESAPQQDQDQTQLISATKRFISDTLELLYGVAGYHSFFLTINPNDEADEGFLGGTILGREFWRGHRGCGASGALAFKLFCQKAVNTIMRSSSSSPGPSLTNPMSQVLRQPQGPGSTTQDVGVAAYPTNVPTTTAGAFPSSSTPKKNQASTIKAEVYASVRSAIRTVTGRRNAEMKWSNHERLVDSYGIRLEGWPPSVPKQNPSVLSSAQNKAILEALANGSMQFVPVQTPITDSGGLQSGGKDVGNRGRLGREQDIFEDTVDFEAGDRGDAFIEKSSGEFFVARHDQSEDILSGASQIILDTRTMEEIDRGGDTAEEPDKSQTSPSNGNGGDGEDAGVTGMRKRRRMGSAGEM